MERKHKKQENKVYDDVYGSDDVDHTKVNPQDASRKPTKPFYYHELSPSLSDGFERLESPEQDDSAYHTLHHNFSTSHSFHKSSSDASSNPFPSQESLRSSSPLSSGASHSKKVHSTLIRIQLGDDKKLSHDWYSEFTSQSSQHKNAFSSPLANRSVNSSSLLEYDSHIAHMRGNLPHTSFLKNKVAIRTKQKYLKKHSSIVTQTLNYIKQTDSLLSFSFINF